MTTTCTVSSDAGNQFDILQRSLSSANSTAALILKCVKGPNQVVVDQVKQNVRPEDLEEEMPGVNRYVVYRCGWVLPQDDSRIVPKLIFVWFNPLNTPIDIKRMYQATEIALEKHWNGIQHFQINNAADFTEKWLRQNGFTSQFLSAQHLTSIPGVANQVTGDTATPTEFPYGTKFNPHTGEPIPKFDTHTGRQNW